MNSMESLQLPRDLYWDGKMEPSSPSSELFSLSNAEESWLFEDNFAEELLTLEECTKIKNEDLSKIELDGELLLELEYDAKQEQWVDGKPLGGFPVLEYTPDVLPQPTNIQKVQDSYEIINELEKFYGGSELIQLTPPQTPPQQSFSENKSAFNIFQQTPSNHCSETYHQQQPQQLQQFPEQLPQLIQYEQGQQLQQLQQPEGLPLQQHFSIFNRNQITENEVPSPAMSPAGGRCSPASPIDYNSDQGSVSPSPPSSMSSDDIARDVEIVDEILRARAKDLPDWSDDDENSMYSTSSSSGGSQNCSNDDDWAMSSASSVSSLSPRDNKNSGKKSKSTTGRSEGGVTKRRPRPYGRGAEDKKSRKKEQNKNAATRYRQKKKQEMEEILEEEHQLAERNEELTKTVTEIQREVKYLKKLIREFHGSKFSQ